jgi:hypothetical protein
LVIKICYICVWLNVKDVNSRSLFYYIMAHRHFLSYRSLISGWLWLVSKAIFALRVSMPVYILRKKKEERNPLGMRRQPSRKRRNNLCNNLSFSLSLFCLIVVVVVELPLIMGNWQSTVSFSSIQTRF